MKKILSRLFRKARRKVFCTIAYWCRAEICDWNKALASEQRYRLDLELRRAHKLRRNSRLMPEEVYAMVEKWEGEDRERRLRLLAASGD